MTSGMPELGSKISLISKADIRYEGRLFTVDPQECTIALASVRSFGTEDRETQYPVPAQNQVYDYILFRGSDIKDIRVVNNVPHPQPLNDPAIMQLSVPPSLGGQQYQTHPVLGQIAPQMAQFGAYGSIGGAIGSLGGALAPGMHIQRDGRGMSNKPNSVLDLIGGGSRSTTPASLSSRKSPTADQGTQAGGGKRDDKKTVKPIQPPGHQRNQNQHQQQRNKSRERGDSRGDGQNRQPNRQQNYHGHHGGNQGNNYHHQNYNNQHHNQQQQHQQGNQQNRGSGGGGGGWTNRGPMRPRGRPRGGFKSNQGQPNQGNKPKNTLKFENDYDFEQANTEFEELRSQLAKVKVDEGSSSTSTKSEAVNGTAAADGVAVATNDADKKDDSGNETGAGEPEHEEDQEIFYDKAKSFFDKISCEAVERAKGKSQRTDWRVERKLNSETFGVSAARRGNYRGRGGYRGMSYRGGYRGGYRQPQRRDQHHQQQQQQQQGQQQGNRSASEQTEKTSLDVQNTTSSVQASDKKIVASESETDQNSIPSSSTTEQVSVAEPAMAGGSEQIQTPQQ
ncbi:unnamed protein product [Brassicogethes aeneus]|uniref:Uncharacterized protein n=1 Tax=Brassicogethes aeneus TaxID=1431903 RepID=A0A9P0AQQ4_BRAAE|nr:unnamed protein product [Brassicogethes aeneus]